MLLHIRIYSTNRNIINIDNMGDVMTGARDVLNEIKWTESRELKEVEITYIHRGVPDDAKTIPGTAVRQVGRNYHELDDSSIPYHRIIKILYLGDVVYEKRKE